MPNGIPSGEFGPKHFVRAFQAGHQIRIKDAEMRSLVYARGEKGSILEAASLEQQRNYTRHIAESLGMSLGQLAMPRDWFDALSEGFTKEIFANPNQAYKSDHNIPHGYIVAQIAFIAGQYLNSLHAVAPEKYPSQFSQVELLALVTAGTLHDAQRHGDVRESVKESAIVRHMLLAQEKAAEILHRPEFTNLHRLVEQNGGDYESFIGLVGLLSKYHGDETGTPSVEEQEAYPHLLELSDCIKVADAKTLQRLFISHHRVLVRPIAGYINETRNHRVLQEVAKNDTEQAYTASESLRFLATMLDVMMRHRAEHSKDGYDPDNQKKQFAQVLEDLGLLERKYEDNEAAAFHPKWNVRELVTQPGAIQRFLIGARQHIQQLLIRPV